MRLGNRKELRDVEGRVRGMVASFGENLKTFFSGIERSIRGKKEALFSFEEQTRSELEMVRLFIRYSKPTRHISNTNWLFLCSSIPIMLGLLHYWLRT